VVHVLGRGFRIAKCITSARDSNIPKMDRYTSSHPQFEYLGKLDSLPQHALLLSPFSLTSAQSISEKITWGKCSHPYDDVTSVALECGALTVPLDYADAESNGTHILDLIKTPAKDQPSEGTIVMSFGGQALMLLLISSL